MTPSSAGKGDDCRIGDFNIYRDNYDRIFGGNKAIQDVSSECQIISHEESQKILNNYIATQQQGLKDSCGLSDEEFKEYIEQRRKEIPSKPQLKEDMFAEEAEEV